MGDRRGSFQIETGAVGVVRGYLLYKIINTRFFVGYRKCHSGQITALLRANEYAVTWQAPGASSTCAKEQVTSAK